MDGEQTGVPQNAAPESPAASLEVVYAAIAERVRADSIKGQLTLFQAIAPLTPDPEKAQTTASSLMGTPGYEDIRLIRGMQGVRYLYSERGLSQSQAEKVVFAYEVRDRIAQRVRHDSGQLNKLTALNSLGALIPGAEPDKIDGQLEAMAVDDVYKDISVLISCKGERFLYSTASMTAGYATILSRAEGGDPCQTVAATVREDSRIYPRPTPIGQFQTAVFGINPSDLNRVVNEVVSREQFRDIKQVRASTGALYLYSDLYVDPEWVNATVEWEEVGRYLNP